MKKKILYLLLITSISLRADTSKTYNTFEVGRTYATLFNKAGFKYGYQTTAFYLGYTRQINKGSLFYKADFHHYQQYNGTNIDKTKYYNFPRYQGVNYATTYNVIRACLGKRILKSKFQIMPYLSLNYRWGKGEKIFWQWMDSGPYNNFLPNYSNYSAIGAGIGYSVNYNIYKKWLIGIDNNASYYLQKIKLENTQDEYPDFRDNYKPNRFSVSLHLKVGYMF